MQHTASLSRFYALPVTAAIAAAIDTDFAQADLDDLVHAHLSRNPLYFGGIDKTLSGFVVLDDSGDNYTLLDLRGDGSVWRQDHETRQLELRFASLEDYLACRARLAKGEDSEAALLAEYACTPRAQAGDSAALLARFQWLMHALALPARDHQGNALHSPDTLALDAYTRYIPLFPEPGDDQRCFRKELPRLAGDPHLALYWLLHASLLGQDARLAKVLAAIGPTEVPLLQAFVAVFGHLADDADIAVVPGFAHRRARLLLLAQIDSAAPLQQRLRAMAVSPHTVGMELVDELTLALQNDPDTFDAAQALQALDRIQADATAVWALRAYLQNHLGQPAGAAADRATRLMAATAHAPLDAVKALHPILPLIGDGDALLRVVTPLLAWDDLMTRVLDMLEHAQILLGIEVIAADARAHLRHLADDLLTIWDAPSFDEGVAAAAPATREAMAIRLTRRPELADADEDREWAIRFVLGSPLHGRGALLQRALPQLAPRLQRRLLPDICARITDPGDGLVPMLVALIGEEPPAGDISAEIDADARADAVLEGLQPLWGDARLFEPLMALLERAPVKSVLVDRVGQAIRPFQAALDTAQRQRLFHWALARVQARQDDHWSPRILSGLGTPDLAPTLRRALQAESAAMAAGQPASEEVLSRLYDSLGELGKQDPDTASFLIDRLWEEQAYVRGVYWALHGCWSPPLHAQVMQRLRECPRIAAAATYCVSVHAWDKRTQPALDVAALVLDWPLPDDSASRAQLKYLLLLGSSLALLQQQPAQVRAFHHRATAIDGPAREPGARTDAAFDPFSTADLQARLQDALDGKAERELASQHARLQQARADGTPDTRITLQALGQLAGGTAAFAWCRDPVSGTTLFQDVLGNTHYFDGYAIVAPPFQLQGYTLRDEGPAFFHDATEVSERWMCWKGETFYDWTRLGAAINVIHGENNAAGQVNLALRFASAAEAAQWFAAVTANPPRSFVACDPWYRAGHGEVSRTLYNPRKPGGTYLRLRNQAWTDADGNRLLGDAALAAVNALEVDARRAGGFTYTIEYQDDFKRPQDLSVLDWLTEVRAVHADTLAESLEQTVDVVATYLAAHVLKPAGTALGVRRDGPASAADIDALAASRHNPLPAALVAYWQEHACTGWHYPGHGRRLLSPAEILASAAVDGRRPLVVDAHGQPQWLLADAENEDQHVVPLDPAVDRRYQYSAHGGVRTALASTLLDALERDVADIALLWHGQRGDADVVRLQLASEREVTTLRLDRDACVLAIRKGKRGQPGRVRFQHLATPAKAAAAFDRARKVAEAAGQQAHASA